MVSRYNFQGSVDEVIVIGEVGISKRVPSFNNTYDFAANA